MFVLLGNKLTKKGDYEGATMLFKRAQLQSPPRTSPYLKTISLVSDHTSTLLQYMLILLDRYLDGNLTDLLCQSEDNYAKRYMPLAG